MGSAFIVGALLDLMPNFTSAAHQLHDELAPVPVVAAAAGLSVIGIQTYHRRSADGVLMKLLTLTMVVILVGGGMGTFGNLLNDFVTAVDTDMGIFWNGGNPGNVFAAYRDAIANKWGTNSVAAGQRQLYQTVNSQGTAQSQGLSAPTNTNVHFTRYGYAGDSTGDTNSANGIGNHGNALTAGQSVAISNKLAQQYGLQVGQTVQFTTSSGQTVTGTYDDTVPDGVWKNPATGKVSLTQQTPNDQYIDESNNIDIYDPNGQALNLDGAAITGINGVGAASTLNNNASGTGGSGLWATVSNVLTSPFYAILGALVYFLSIVAAGLMAIMTLIQQVLFITEIAVSPVMVGFLMIPGLSGIAVRFLSTFASLCIWPFGWAVADIVTRALLDLAINPTNNVVQGMADSAGGELGLWTLLGIWVIVTSAIAPIMVTAAFWVGSTGVGRMAGVTFGPIANQGRQNLYRQLMLGASALQAATINGVRQGLNGTNGKAAQRASNLQTAAATGIAPNHARRAPAVKPRPNQPPPP